MYHQWYATMQQEPYRRELELQKREMQIQLIREQHPVYKDFNFEAYSSQKIAEMYYILIETKIGDKGTKVQTKV